MDPRERADAALARARARGVFVVTPDDAVSPMDAASTLQIPRAVVHAAEQSESTGRVLPTGTTRGHLPPQQPMQQQQMPPQQQQMPPQQQPQQQPPPTQYLQPVQSHQPPQPAQQQGHPPQRGHQTGPHQPVPYPGPPQQQQQQQPARPEPQPEPQYDEPPRQLDGLVPTTQQPGTQRSMMSRRLDGH